MDVVVIGLGAMGSGIARALLHSSSTTQVSGVDVRFEASAMFMNDAINAKKASTKNTTPFIRPSDAISHSTDVVVLVLTNADQCRAVCLGSSNDSSREKAGDKGSTDDSDEDVGIISLMKPGSVVMMCSTVPPSFVREIASHFAKRNVETVDCPVSGGPVRALKGDLTTMASGTESAILKARPLLDAMSRVVHILPGGSVGYGSSAKAAHQLLAGVHIVAAAEALALASKAGIDPETMYDIVCGGAAGMSWMFGDRGKRMVEDSQSEGGGKDVKSTLGIFIKDLDIVQGEARRLGSPVPLAAAALQQFVAGKGMGLESSDDSSVVKVYGNLSETSSVLRENNKVLQKQQQQQQNQQQQQQQKQTKGKQVDEALFMTKENGSAEKVLEVYDEPRHNLILSNRYVNVLSVSFPPGDQTCAHVHREDSLYFFLVEGGIDLINHVRGSSPCCDRVEFGEVRYGPHKTDTPEKGPFVHRISNMSPDKQMLCLDAEIVGRASIIFPLPFMAPGHELIKTRDKLRVYRFTLKPGEGGLDVSYPFYHLSIVINGSRLMMQDSSKSSNDLSWEVAPERGDVEWNGPSIGVKMTNISTDVIFEKYIVEWC